MKWKTIWIGVAIAAACPVMGSPPNGAYNRGEIARARLDGTQTTAPMRRQIVIARKPYTIGQAIFSGKYNLGHPKLTKANIAEKESRLASLQRILAPRDGQQLCPKELALRLTNREMNALEYFLTARFDKRLNRPPSWAKEEPPVKVTFAN